MCTLWERSHHGRGRWTGRAGLRRGASGPAEHICSYIMPVLLTGKDKEESHTKAVPTVAMAVSKPPSLIPPNRLSFGLQLRLHVSGSGPHPGHRCSSPPEGPLRQACLRRSCLSALHASTHMCTHTHAHAHTECGDGWEGACPQGGCPVVSCSSPRHTALLAR